MPRKQANLDTSAHPLVVSPLDAVKRNAEGKKERLSVMEETSAMAKRNSIMAPEPRLSTGKTMNRCTHE